MSILFIISELFGTSRYSVVNPVCNVLNGLKLAIPCTTRTSRIEENQDSSFAFAPLESFEFMIAREELLEYVNILGNYYGTPLKCLQQARDNGDDLLVRADYRGVEQIKSKVPDAVSVLILPAPAAMGKEILSSANSPWPSFPFRELLQPSIQELLSQFQLPNPDKYDHTIVYDRPEEGTVRLMEIIRTERMRRH